MRLKVKEKPSYGDYRTIERFALFPVRIRDELVWLEKYWQKEQFRRDKIGRGWWSDYAKFLKEELRGGD